jgi:hypothetical protein
VRLEAITAALRPRNAWEAIDLGFALVQRGWKPLYKNWLVVLLLFTVILHILCSQALWLVPCLIWWLKPLLDRIPLYVLSHALFGEAPSLRQTVKDLPSLLRPQAFAVLTYARLNPARSFHLPVRQLEGLHGKQRRQRQKILSARDRGAAVWLTIACIHLEIVVNLAIIGFVGMLMIDFTGFLSVDLFTSTSVLQQLCFNGLFLCGISLIEPFYVAAGFTLYLNRRIWLEGWDMEIGFRRLAQRLTQHGTLSIIAVTGVWLGLSVVQPVVAAPEKPASELTLECQVLREQQARLENASSPVKRTLAQVLQEDPFPHCIPRQRWFLEMQSEEPQNLPTSPLGQTLAKLMEIGLWVTVIVFTGVVMWHIYKIVPASSGQKATTLASSLPSLLQGLDKPDIEVSATTAKDVWMLWRAGREREALSLMYRNTLLSFSKSQGVKFTGAATEDECLHIASTQLSWDHEWVRFLKRLTRIWSALAYGHHLPNDEEVHQLCQQWSKHFQAIS